MTTVHELILSNATIHKARITYPKAVRYKARSAEEEGKA